MAPVPEFIWSVERNQGDRWETVAIPVAEVYADIYIAELSADLSPRDFRKVSYKRIDPEAPQIKQEKAPPEKEHAEV